jgi:hypothetical protein
MLRTIKQIFVSAVLLVGLFALPANAQNVETQKAIIELIKVSGMMKTMDQLAEVVGISVVEQVKKKHPNMTDDHAKIIREELAAGFRDGTPEFLASAAPLYGKHFTLEEIKDLTAFYKTKTGQKAMQVLPVLMQESMTLGQQWAQRIIPSTMEKIKSRLLAKGLAL